MHDDLKQLNDQVLKTLGQPVTLITEDLETETRGIISKELVPTGQFDSVMQEITTLCIERSFELKRGSQVESGIQQWTVDRKLKDDGYFTFWNLHEVRS